MKKPSFLLCLVALSFFAIHLVGAEIKEISTPHEPSRILLSEDHSYLAVTHYDENLVSIINTETLEIEKQIESSAPGPMLSRGETFYLSDTEKGMVKAYSQKSWEQQDELYAGSEKILQLSAPQRNHFKGNILISFYGLADNERFISLLDVEKDEFKIVRKDEVRRAAYSYTGELIAEQYHSDLRMLASDNYYPGSIEYLANVDSNNRHNPFQVNDSDLWFTRTYITTSTSPKQYTKDLKGLIIPDSNPQSKMCYVLNADCTNVSIHNLDNTFTEIQKMELIHDAKLQPRVDIYGRNIDTKQDGRVFAYSKSGKVTLFLLDSRKRLLSVQFELPKRDTATGENQYKKQLPAANSYTILKAPEGTSISESGLINWTPGTAHEPGQYQFKIKLTTDEKTEFFRDHFSVTAQAISAEKRFPQPTRHDKTFLYSDTIGNKLYVHTDNKITIFDAAGSHRIREAELKQSYKQILTTETDLVALNTHRVDFYEIGTMELRKQVELEGIKAHNMAYDRQHNYVYVGGFDEKESSGAKGYPILQIDPKTGSLRKQERSLGQTVYISPYSNLMVTSIHDKKFHVVGYSYLKQEIDVLSIYKLSNGTPELLDMSEGMVTGISDIQFIADGQHIMTKAASASYGGQRIYQRSPIFKSNSLEKPVSFVTKREDNTFGSVISLAAHPKRDLIAALSKGKDEGAITPSLLDFRDLAGNPIGNVIDPKIRLNNHPASISFTPDGQSLLLVNRDFYGRKTIQKIPLQLNASIAEFSASYAPQQQLEDTPDTTSSSSYTDNSASGGSVRPSHAADSSERLLPLWEATKLTTPYTDRFTPDIIGLINMPAVVIISSEGESTGTGFFISGSGHILTAAHVIPEIRNPQVTCYLDFSVYRTEFTLDASVVDIDHENDLALLKVDTGFATQSVRLQKRPTYYGAPVYAIGHPGVGNISLNYTMTDGIVSHPNQDYQNKNYLQISAPINPGNSGGPVFDSKGNVIGLVTSKFMMEGVSFAIPVDRITPFLSKNMDRSRATSTDEKTLNSIQKAAAREGSQTLSAVTFRNNIVYHRDSERPYTGTIVCGNNKGGIGIRMRYVNGRLNGQLEEYYSNGQLRHSYSYKSGIYHGECRSWYASGNLMQVYNQRYDKMEGIDRIYFDEPGKVKRMVSYRNGKKNGTAYTMNEQGFLLERVFFKNDHAARNTRHFPRGYQPANRFHEFIKAGDLEMVQNFPDAAKLVTIPNNAGNYPIHIAVKVNDADMVGLLVELGAEVSAQNKEQKTALDLEKEKDNPDPKLIKHLISNYR